MNKTKLNKCRNLLFCKNNIEELRFGLIDEELKSISITITDMNIFSLKIVL